MCVLVSSAASGLNDVSADGSAAVSSPPRCGRAVGRLGVVELARQSERDSARKAAVIRMPRSRESLTTGSQQMRDA
jgi:hypothetical protein